MNRRGYGSEGEYLVHDYLIGQGYKVLDMNYRRGPGEIAGRYGWDAALVEQIARLYVTHPGVTAEGIMGKMGP